MGVAAARNLILGLPWSLAVVRPRDDELARLLREEGLEVVCCDESPHGLSRSIACGVAASNAASGWVLALGDMPYIRPSTICAVSAAIEQGATIAVAEHCGQRGHPVGFGRQLQTELRQLHGDVGARSLIQRYDAHVVRIPVDDAGVVQDVDTLEDVVRDPRL